MRPDPAKLDTVGNGYSAADTPQLIKLVSSSGDDAVADRATDAKDVADPQAGQVRVMADRCGSCVYRPDGLQLTPG